MSIEKSIESVGRLRDGLSQVIRGRGDTIDMVLTGLLAKGHALIEDYPGSGKTTLAKTLGRLVEFGSTGGFRRVQFTPDLLPSDVLGVTVFDPKDNSFQFQEGPIFSNILLADEINRTGPKVQSAFLECMAEQQVTVDNKTYPLDSVFFVIATQNPVDLAGTFPLPVVQLDRFILKISMGYVDTAELEMDVINSADEIQSKSKELSPVLSKQELLEAQEAVGKVHIEESILKTVVSIVRNSREYSAFQMGASTRAGIMLKKALCAFALCKGRDYVNEDDVLQVTPFVIRHRVLPNLSLKQAEQIFDEYLKKELDKLVSLKVV